VKRGPCPDGRVFAFIEVESTPCSLRTCATRSARPTARGRANTGPLNASPAELPSHGVALMSLHGDVVAGVARLATHRRIRARRSLCPSRHNDVGHTALAAPGTGDLDHRPVHTEAHRFGALERVTISTRWRWRWPCCRDPGGAWGCLGGTVAGGAWVEGEPGCRDVAAAVCG
jgi:hypothetical protein